MSASLAKYLIKTIKLPGVVIVANLSLKQRDEERNLNGQPFIMKITKKEVNTGYVMVGIIYSQTICGNYVGNTVNPITNPDNGDRVFTFFADGYTGAIPFPEGCDKETFLGKKVKITVEFLN